MSKRITLIAFAFVSQASLVMARKMKWRWTWFVLNCYFELAEERQQLKFRVRELEGMLE